MCSAPACQWIFRGATLGLFVSLCALGLSPALSGCGSSAPAASAPASARGAGGSPAAAQRVAEALRAETGRWEGTPYRMGGTTRQGVDCSAFVQHLFDRTLDVELSRSTRSQVREGQRVAKGDLRAGDLVFFRPGGKTRHVGVYVGDGEFAHASTSAGPTISPLGRDYWQDNYWMARRVVRLASGAPTGEAAAAEATPRAERAGW